MIIMKNWTFVLSAVLLGAGCAHRDSNYQGASATDWNANNSVTSEASSSNTKGAGARTLTGDNSNTDPSTTGITTATTTDSSARTTEASAENSKGAGGRAIVGGNAATEGAPAGNVVTTDTSVRSTEASDSNTKGAGARAITGSTEGSDAAFSDERFVREAAQGGLAEVKMGELVAKNGQDQSVKDFGQRIQADHTKANEELMKIASAKGLTAPTEISAKDNQMIEHLSSLNGAEFDAATRKHAVTAHEKAVRLFKQASESAKDPELKAFAQKTLPTLQEHLDMAKHLASTSAPEVK